MHINYIRIGIKVIAPYIFKDLGPGCLLLFRSTYASLILLYHLFGVYQDKNRYQIKFFNTS